MPPSDAPAAICADGERVNVVTPEGSTVSVPCESVAVALDRGFRLETVDEGIRRAAAEGAAADDDDPNLGRNVGIIVGCVLTLAILVVILRRR